MRDRFEIVHMRDNGSYDVLMRYAPKKSHHRWEAAISEDVSDHVPRAKP